jgi:hypothetical protein
MVIPTCIALGIVLRFVPGHLFSLPGMAAVGAATTLSPIFVLRLVPLNPVFPDLSEIPVRIETLGRLLSLLAEVGAPDGLLIVEWGMDKQALTVVQGGGHALLRFGPRDEGYKSESWFRGRGLPVFTHALDDESFFDVQLPAEAPAETLLIIMARIYGPPEPRLVSVSVRGDNLVEIATHDVLRTAALKALDELPERLTL